MARLNFRNWALAEGALTVTSRFYAMIGQEVSKVLRLERRFRDSVTLLQQGSLDLLPPRITSRPGKHTSTLHGLHV